MPPKKVSIFTIFFYNDVAVNVVCIHRLLSQVVENIESIASTATSLSIPPSQLTPQPLFTDVNLSQSTVQPQLTGQDNEIDMLESLSEVLYGATEAQQKYANKISNY